MESKLGAAIWKARRAVGLTQKELAKRLGLQEQAVRRWEWEDALPSPVNRQALVAAIAALDAEAAQKLAAVIDEELNGTASDASMAASEAARVVPRPGVVEPPNYAVLKMAEDLDVPPRRVRAAVMAFLNQLHDSNISIETAVHLLERRDNELN